MRYRLCCMHDINDLCSLADIAGMFSTTSAAVTNWTKRYKKFPAPLKLFTMGPVFSRKDVVDWYWSDEMSSFRYRRMR